MRPAVQIRGAWHLHHNRTGGEGHERNSRKVRNHVRRDVGGRVVHLVQQLLSACPGRQLTAGALHFAHLEAASPQGVRPIPIPQHSERQPGGGERLLTLWQPAVWDPVSILTGSILTGSI